jgi:hypothetical protein
MRQSFIPIRSSKITANLNQETFSSATTQASEDPSGGQDTSGVTLALAEQTLIYLHILSLPTNGSLRLENEVVNTDTSHEVVPIEDRTLLNAQLAFAELDRCHLVNPAIDETDDRDEWQPTSFQPVSHTHLDLRALLSLTGRLAALPLYLLCDTQLHLMAIFACALRRENASILQKHYRLLLSSWKIKEIHD